MYVFKMPVSNIDPVSIGWRFPAISEQLTKIISNYMKIIAVKLFQLKRLKRRNLTENSGLNENRTHDLCDTGAAL